MRDLIILLIHLIATLARLMGPGVALKRLKPSLPILFGYLGSSERPGWLSTRVESATYQRDKGACNSHAVFKMSPRPGTI